MNRASSDFRCDVQPVFDGIRARTSSTPGNRRVVLLIARAVGHVDATARTTGIVVAVIREEYNPIEARACACVCARRVGYNPIGARAQYRPWQRTNGTLHRDSVLDTLRDARDVCVRTDDRD